MKTHLIKLVTGAFLAITCASQITYAQVEPQNTLEQARSETMSLFAQNQKTLVGSFFGACDPQTGRETSDEPIEVCLIYLVKTTAGMRVLASKLPGFHGFPYRYKGTLVYMKVTGPLKFHPQ